MRAWAIYQNLPKSLTSLDADKPFVQCVQGECPAGRFPGRTYANYATKNGVKLTESKMAEDLKSIVFAENDEKIGKISIIDTAAEGHLRPTTATTARDTAEEFVVNIQSGRYGDQKHFEILFESNNPYIKRQALAAQREVNDVLIKHGLDKQGYTIKIEGIGFSFKQDVATIHSEFGALIAEEWKNATNNKRNIQDLLYQTRNANTPVDDALDDEIGTLGGLKLSLIDWFDEF